MTPQTAIALTKIPHSKLLVIYKAMLNYVTQLQSNNMSVTDKQQASIITQLYHEKVKTKINKQFPSQTHKISLVWHEANALLNSFIEFQRVCGDHLEYVIIEKLKTELHTQLV